MSLKTVKRLASRVLNCGTTRVRIVDLARAKEVLTADDVRNLIKEGGIERKPVVGQSRVKATRKAKRKKAGRRRGEGSKEGAYNSTQSKKERWMEKVRSQRLLLTQIKPRLVDGAYARLYRKVKGNNFKNKRTLNAYITENNLLK